MKWNGIEWKDIGFGNTLSFISIYKMLVYHEKLWVFGNFSSVASMNACNVAVYDSINWCTLSDTIPNTIVSATIYNDTIYIAGGFTKINSDTNIVYIAKLKYTTLYNQCVNVGIKEEADKLILKINPNPTSNILNIYDAQNLLQNATIEIKNYLGQIIFTTPFNIQIDLSNLTTGMYFLSIKDKEYKKTVKVIKQ